MQRFERGYPRQQNQHAGCGKGDQCRTITIISNSHACCTRGLSRSKILFPRECCELDAPKKKSVALLKVVGGGGLHRPWDPVPKKSYHHLGLSLRGRMNPDEGAARVQAPGCQRSSCGSVRRGRRACLIIFIYGETNKQFRTSVQNVYGKTSKIKGKVLSWNQRQENQNANYTKTYHWISSKLTPADASNSCASFCI